VGVSLPHHAAIREPSTLLLVAPPACGVAGDAGDDEEPANGVKRRDHRRNPFVGAAFLTPRCVEADKLCLFYGLGAPASAPLLARPVSMAL
jgi:hypothetical protein